MQTAVNLLSGGSKADGLKSVQENRGQNTEIEVMFEQIQYCSRFLCQGKAGQDRCQSCYRQVAPCLVQGVRRP